MFAETHAYQPFPSCAEFLASVDLGDLGPYPLFAERFMRLKSQTPTPVLKQAVETATRWAAVDTGAIEGLYSVDRGFTMSVAVTAQALDQAHRHVGTEGQDHIRDALNGYELVLDVATGNRPITGKLIRELHHTICMTQDVYRVYTGDGQALDRPLPKGTYKEHPNSPARPDGSVHHYAAPGPETVAEMERLVDEITAPSFTELQPILKAAYAHYAFVRIHPFADGNGRVARALASMFLYQSPGIPLVIFADQTATYIASLEEADEGRTRPFVSFLSTCVIDTMALLETHLNQPVTPDAEQLRKELRANLLSKSGLLHDDVDRLEARVREAWHDALDAAVVDLGLSEEDGAGIRVLSVQQSGAPVISVDGLRRSPASQVVLMVGNVEPPAKVEISRRYTALIPKAGSGRDDGDYFIYGQDGQLLASVFLREINPVVTETLKHRLRTVANTEARVLLVELNEKALGVLRSAGYAE